MSIRPVDLQTGLSRIVETARINNSNNTRADEQHQVFSQRLERQVELETTQVLQSSKADYNKVEQDGRNTSQREGKKKKKDGKDAKKEQTNTAFKQNKNSTSMYDISI